MHKNLTLDRILAPVIPEFRDCARCGVPLAAKTTTNHCLDCKGLNVFKANNQQAGNGNFLPVDPAYEVALHYGTRPHLDRTAKTLDAVLIPYFTYYEARDPLEVAYARSLFRADTEPEWPIVLITAHGKVIDHWTGFDLARVNAIPAARAAAVSTHTEAEAQAQPGVPIERKQQAA